MKMNSYSKGIGLSIMAAMVLCSNAYAGKIIGVTAGTPHVLTDPPTQYGFGGWNLDNVNVKITDLEFNEIAKSFYPDGTYDTMVIGDTFESEISVDGEIRGLLHGKNWPVGEPSGVKVVNDDLGTAKSGKSQNCIMTTSYLDAVDSGTGESGYLDIYDTNPDGIAVPTVCSSPFQSHKRFKINMQPTTVAGVVPGAEGVYGKPIDLVFNLDVNDLDLNTSRYQVFSKINNYTGMRLDGYKVELLDENGTEVNASNAIKFSLDLTTKLTSDDESGYEAVFSNGLWGPKDTEVRDIPHFTEDGFFDDTRAGFVQDGNDTQLLTGGPDTLVSNYVDLFGVWLPSKWAPYGIFWDDDNDTTTDAELVAFWGDPLDTGTNAWHKGNDYNTTDAIEPWEIVTETELDAWNVNEVGSLYSISKIEDTVNLGLNYVVEVGLNSTIGSKFTIRITPRVAPLAAQTPPSYIDAAGNYILPPQLIVPTDPIDPTVPPTDPTVPTDPIVSSSDGGSCTFNPNSKGVDTTVLLMLAMGMLYPFRRRFIK